MASRHRKVAVTIFNHHAKKIGGIEMHARQMARLLSQKGWQVVLCFPHPPNADVREFMASPHVTFETLPSLPSNSWRTSVDLGRLFRRYRPRLVHFQFTPFLGLNTWAARLSGASQIVFTDHGSHPENYRATPAPFWKRATARLLNLPLSKVVVVSEYKKNTFETLGTVSKSRLQRIYNGVDLTRSLFQDAGARFREQHGIPLRKILILQASSITPEKGIVDVLEAARVALQEEPTLHFSFAGDGRYRPEYMERAKALGIAGDVTWLGVIRDPLGEGLFAAADVYCQASRWQEAFGMAIAEAMAAGKPVCATRVGGISELVEDGSTGYLVDLGDHARLAESFVRLARDGALRRRLGQAGAERARAKFDLHKNANELLEVYNLC